MFLPSPYLLFDFVHESKLFIEVFTEHVLAQLGHQVFSAGTHPLGKHDDTWSTLHSCDLNAFDYLGANNNVMLIQCTLGQFIRYLKVD